jgi:metallo-beta-lactamase family protein
MKKVFIFGEEHHVHASIETLDAFSGHADQGELLNWFEGITGPKKHVFLVHGEPERSEVLAEALRESHPEQNITVASRLQVVVL